MKQEYSREQIRARMRKHAAKAWGYQEQQMETGFDPLVDLLMSACATELEKINREITSSNERVLDRLIEILIPDVHVNSLPAHTVIHARSVRPSYYIRHTDELLTSKEDENEESQNIFFSAAAPYRIIDGDVRYLAMDKQLIRVDEIPYRDTLIQQSLGKGLEAGTMWIGMAIHADIKSVRELNFFFDWKNITDKNRYFNLLDAAEWSLNGAFPLHTTRGYTKKKTQAYKEIHSPFEVDYNPTGRRVREVEQYYQPQFIRIEDYKADIPTESPHDMKQPYPKALEEAFSVEELAVIEDQTLWIKVQFPTFFPKEALLKTECHTNCFPALNRKIYQPADKRLSNYLSIIPLQCDDFFFDLGMVENRNKVRYHEIPLTNIRRYQAGKYTLRRNGVGRFNERGASHKLFELIDLLRDESAAFDAYDFDYLSSKVRTLTQEVTDLEQQVIRNTRLKETVPYLIVKPMELGEFINLEYWSTSGALANKIESGKQLDMYRPTSFRRGGIVLVTPSMGGRNEMSNSEKTFMYKRALISRERIVTREDLKAYCWSKLGNKAQEIELKKGFKVDDKPSGGIIRTQEVTIKPSANQQKVISEFELALSALEVELNNRSAAVIPIVVKMQL